MKRVGQTLSSIVGCNTFDLFEQHNQTCWIVLDGVGRSDVKWSLTLFKLFIQHHPTFPFAWSKVRHNFVHGTEIQHCWIMLDSFEHFSIQHNPTLIKYHPTPPNNVGCLTNMFDPFEWAFTLFCSTSIHSDAHAFSTCKDQNTSRQLFGPLGLVSTAYVPNKRAHEIIDALHFHFWKQRTTIFKDMFRHAYMPPSV